MYGRTNHRTWPSDPVRTVMMWPVATVETDASMTQVAEALSADEIGALCVVEHGALAGIVSERDAVTHLAAGANPAHMTAGEMMSSDLITVGPEDSVLSVARMMREAQVRHLPVVDDDQIAGIVSIRDVFNVLIDAAADDAEVVFVPSGSRVVVRTE
ncbi:cyclic nucleotide-binding/CBS domain-containing protein [Nocardioides cynanchi]|uniref:CBS domain-containing protein n=1 Tax=Nocardioides cynanchi TaxID=2558918 RepID=UPI001783BC10|nr:CBS domain-containing protein [Nocardioides cynanchi]